MTAARKAKVARAIHPNAGIEADYRRRLDKLVGEMHASLVYWITAAYRGNAPEIAADESPAMVLRGVMRKLARRWQREFDKVAQERASRFVREVASHTDRSFRSALNTAGFTVRFRMTPALNDVIQASVGQNVALIKSIASQHLAQVEGIVMRSVAAGRDLASLTKDLEQQHGVTRRRAANIALDQNNKATAAVTRARQDSLGITEAVWLHSHAGKTPRPTHQAMDGKRYKVAQGMWDPAVRRWIFPGEEPGCRCVSRSVIPGFV